MVTTKILMVDDERHMSAMTSEYLTSQGYHVVLAHSGESGYVEFRKDEFDICILDIKMPIKDGYTLATEIKAVNPTMPIIFLTGNSEAAERVKGLKFGADDYITKPYSLEELDLRIQNVLRRANQSIEISTKANFSIGSYVFNAHTREIVLDNDKKQLTTIENKLLHMFVESNDNILKREVALKRIWGDDHNLHGRSLNVYVSKLRGYLKADPRVEILNIHGVGYRLVVR